jgi:hypothetical protein
VAKLLNEGWRCHVIAHSHGGNIVLEALSKIMTVPNAEMSLGKIVTLGTPFIDVSPRQEWLNQRIRIELMLSSYSIVVLFVVYIVLWSIGHLVRPL